MLIQKLIILSFFIIMGLFVNAQPDPGADPGGQPPPGGGAVPVDGGLVFLLAAGAGYGAKKAYDYRKNKVKSK